MLTKEQIQARNLSVYIEIDISPTGAPQFRKVRAPEKVDTANGYLTMWIPRIPGMSKEQVSQAQEKSYELAGETETESLLREYRGHIIVFDSSGKKVEETPIVKK